MASGLSVVFWDRMVESPGNVRQVGGNRGVQSRVLSLALIFLLAFDAFSLPQTHPLIIGLLEVQDSTDNIDLIALLVGLEEGRLTVNLARSVREMG